ncbi:MAG TPA: RNA polymerase sigma factor [Candidatus Limnocylindria bacterium]|nr:RNA polymerase sigma factor [Candidatus Limnocylindria bacterium]
MGSPIGAYVPRFAAIRDEAPPRTGGVPESGALSDAQLLALARESHERAFDLLYRQHRARVYTFLLRMVADVDLADDLAQDVFTKTFHALPTFGADHRILSWLYRVAHNAAIDAMRRRKRLSWLRLGKVAGTREEPIATDEHGRVPEREQLTAVLRTLPPENASALLLHALEGYSYKEIAEIQGCTMTAVRSRIARARAAFRGTYPTT